MTPKTLILFLLCSAAIFAQEVKILNITISAESKLDKDIKTLLIEVKSPYKTLAEASEIELQVSGSGYNLFDIILFYNHSLGIGIIKARIFETDKIADKIKNLEEASLEIIKSK